MPATPDAPEEEGLPFIGGGECEPCCEACAGGARWFCIAQTSMEANDEAQRSHSRTCCAPGEVDRDDAGEPPLAAAAAAAAASLTTTKPESVRAWPCPCAGWTERCSMLGESVIAAQKNDHPQEIRECAQASWRVAVGQARNGTEWEAEVEHLMRPTTKPRKT